MERQAPLPEKETDHQLLLIDVNALVVKDQELQCPEYCFKVPFNSYQHPRYCAKIHELIILINALYNSIGGVVILCHGPGQTDHVEPDYCSVFTKRLEEWMVSRNPSRKSDMLQLVPLPDDKTAWGLVLVKASPFTDMSSSHQINESGFAVYSNTTTPVLTNEELDTTPSSSAPFFTAAAQTEQHSEASIPDPAPCMEDIDITRHLGNKISWTTNKRNWQQYVVLDDESTLVSNVRNYAASCQMLIPSDPIVFSPSHMLEMLIGEKSDRNRLMKAITATLDSPRAFAIVSPSWLNNIGRDEVAKRPSHHAGDILLVTKKCSVYLWTIIKSSCTDDTLQRTYMMIAGRLTKFLLLKGRKEKCSLRVDCFLYSLQSNTVVEPELQQHTKSVFVNEVELKHIQETLAERIAAKETYLRNIIGEACGYKLSAEQWQIAEHGTSAAVTVVSGPPGSGKTLLCSHFMQQKGKKAECMYVCTNDALAAFMKSQNLSSVQVVQTDTELQNMIERGEFNNKTCIAFDDVHRLSCSDRTTRNLLTLIIRNTDVRLYVFCDNKFQCFDQVRNPLPSAVERCCNRMDIICTTYHLKAIHRNTRRIMSFLSAVSFKRGIKCLHKWEGDDVEVVAAENPLIDSPDNPLIQNILCLLGHKDPESSRQRYAAHDIAVLIDTDSSDQDVWDFQKLLSKYIPNVEIHPAATFPRTGIVVDCLDSFHGLDAGVCLYVLSSTRMKRRDKLYRNIQRGIYNPKYIAFLASRAIHKAVFVVPKLDTKVFKGLLFDCFDEKVIQILLCIVLLFFCACLSVLLFDSSLIWFFKS